MYDKSAHGGKGDRDSRTLPVRRRADVILLEGWCVGFRPSGRGEEDVIDVHLREYAPVFDMLECVVCLEGKCRWVKEWRAEAEPINGMTEEDVASFVERFLPTCRKYYPELKTRSHMIIELDEFRRVRSIRRPSPPSL